MNYEEAYKIVDNFLNDIDAYLKYREIGIYQGINGCIKFIQDLTGCNETIARQIIDSEVELQPSGESIEQYEAEIIKANNEARELLNKPKCPICQSTNLSKITMTKKVAKIAAFGIFGMGDNGKTWKCNNCGSKF